MPIMLALAPLLLAQVGPFVPPGQQSVSPLPPELQERKMRRQPAPAPVAQPKPAVSPKLADCLAAVDADPTQAVPTAEAWMGKASGTERAEAGQCLGVALSRLERWDEAHSVFLLAHDAAAPTDHLRRARLGSMAGNAALAQGDAIAALAALDPAHADAVAAGDTALAGDISIDRARALVALGREKEAVPALAEARQALPNDAQAWLLSATLSRRMGDLVQAQEQIEKAAPLLPIDAEIGLEAGRIAALAGKYDAARKSWRSVVAAVPGTDEARQAQGYIAQLDRQQPVAQAARR
jgi:tetratricopeptide (TPR) repeat protein